MTRNLFMNRDEEDPEPEKIPVEDLRGLFDSEHRLIKKADLYEISLMSEGGPEDGVYPIESVDGKPFKPAEEGFTTTEAAIKANIERGKKQHE